MRNFKVSDNACAAIINLKIILCEAVSDKETSRNFAVAIRSHFGSTNGVDLYLPVRDSGREPPTFD